MVKNVVALVPVKGNSERVPKKNIRKFADTTLLELKLNQLNSTKCFSDIIISSEDADILSVASSFGFNTHNRDPKYSTSDIPMSEVYSYIASNINGDHIAWVNVTNPLVEANIYDKAVKDYSKMNNSFDCLLSVYELKEYVLYEGNPVNFQRNPWSKSQDLNGLTALSFAINILPRKNMVEWGSTVGINPYLFTIDSEASIDIDYQSDFDFCERLYNERLREGTEEI